MSLQEVQANATWDQKARTVINTAIRKLGTVANLVVSASTTVAGLIEIATDAEFLAKTATNKALVPSNLAALPTFMATNGGVAQGSLTSATPVKITFGTETWDTGSYFASSAWTPPVGKYRVSAAVAVDNTNAVDNEPLTLSIYVGGSLFRSSVVRRAGTASKAGCHIATIVNPNGSQAVEVYITKGGAGDGQTTATAAEVWFCGEAIA
jgi:hypothetical protein